MSDLSRQHELSQDRAIKALRKGKAALRRGVVTAVSPLEVSVGGGSSLPAFAVDGCALSVNDQVSVIQQGSQVVVQGRLTDDPVDAGSVGGPFQPLDSDLTAIAALTTTSFGRALLTQADAAATRGTIGVVIGTDVQAYDSDLAAIAALSTTSFGRSLLTQANAAAALATIGAAASSHTHAQSDITSLVSDLALKAPLASPALTGNPTAPTQSAGNNSTRLATTAYADGAVATASTADRARSNHTGTQTASTISDFDTQVRTNRLNQMANPTAAVNFGGQRATNGADGSSTYDFVTVNQLDQVEMIAMLGLRHPQQTPKVSLATTTTLPANTKSGSGPGHTRTATANGALTVDGYSGLTGYSILVLYGDPVNIYNNGIYTVTDGGSASTPWVLTKSTHTLDNSVGVYVSLFLGPTHVGKTFFMSDVGGSDTEVWNRLGGGTPEDHGSRHLPGGADALTTAAAGTIQPDDTAATGSAASFARSDHRHAIAAASASAITGTNAEGSSTSFARADHDHAINLEGTMVACSSDLATGTSAADVTGLTYTTTKAGTYLVEVSLRAACVTASAAFSGTLVVNGSTQSAVLQWNSSAVGQIETVTKTFRVTVGAGQVIKAQAFSSSASAHTVATVNSTMTVQRVA